MGDSGNPSGEQFGAMLDDLPAMLWTSGAEGATGQWNRASRGWFGIPCEASRGPLTELIHADDREAARTGWEQAVSTGQPLATRFRTRAASGDYRWLELSGTPHLADDGRVVAWSCSLIDIHDCKLAQEALAQAEEAARLLDGLVEYLPLGITRQKREQAESSSAFERLKTLIANSPLAVIEWDPERRITAWTGHAESIFGWSAAEVTGKHLDEFGLIHPDDRESVRAAIDALERGEPNSLCNRNCRKDGSVVYCEWYNSALRDSSGRLVWGLSLALDITARRRMEEALRTSEEQYRGIFQAAPLGIFQSTPDGRSLDLNTRLAAMFHYDSREEMLRLVADIPKDIFVHPEQRHDIVRQALEADHFVQAEVLYRCRDGAQFLSGLYMRAVRHGNGEPYLEGFVEDITERRRAEDALREAHDALERRVAGRTAELSAANQRLTELDRLKSQFLASMSHELRTPLNSIIGFTSLLLRGMSGPVNDEQVKQLGIVHSSSAHLLALINDLLDVSRIEAGQADLQHAAFEFSGVVGEVVRILQPMAERKGLQVTVELAEPAIPMLGDRKRALQVLLNLVANAVKFTARGGVNIAAPPAGSALRVEVSDTGIGIKPEHLGMLFEAFRQVDGSAKRVYEGTGLGLYLCRKLLTLMGGEILVESEYGKGSRFVYWLPRQLSTEADLRSGGSHGTEGVAGRG